MKDREIQTRYVEVAISILREAPKPETQNLREWAIATVNTYAKIPLAGEARKELTEHRLSGSSYEQPEERTCKPLPANVEKFIKSFSYNIGLEYCEFRDIARGDFDADGVEDLVLTFSINTCGRDKNGAPVSCGNNSVEYLVAFLGKEYRVIPPREVGSRGWRYIKGLEVKKNIVKAKTEVYESGDPMCCPSKKVNTEFILKDGALVELVK
jgi:hypothetical protein